MEDTNVSDICISSLTHVMLMTRRRCPRPTRAFQTFTKSLFVDQHLLNLSGSKASSGGGLAVSACPPDHANVDQCARWVDWLAQCTSEKDYQALVNLCLRYINPAAAKMGRMGMGMDIDSDGNEMTLVDVETRQFEDLTMMRMRPHSLPYRRYIYIGDVSFGAEGRNRLAAGVSTSYQCRSMYTLMNTGRMHRSRKLCGGAEWCKLAFYPRRTLILIGNLTRYFRELPRYQTATLM